MHLRIVIASVLVVATTSNAYAYKWHRIFNGALGVAISDTGCTTDKDPLPSFCSSEGEVGTVANCFLNRASGQPMPAPGATAPRYQCKQTDLTWCAYKNPKATVNSYPTDPKDLNIASFWECQKD
jgi:hypothetical protein